MSHGRLCIQFKRNKINFRIKRSNIFLLNQNTEIDPCLAISVEKATQSAQELSLKNRQFKVTVVLITSFKKTSATVSYRLPDIASEIGSEVRIFYDFKMIYEVALTADKILDLEIVPKAVPIT